MSEMEMEELAARIKGMAPEEQVIVANNLPFNILWGELHERFIKKSTQIENIRKEVM